MPKHKLDTLAVIKTMGLKFPIAEHPSFKHFWDDYAKKFNRIADFLDEIKMEETERMTIIEFAREAIEAAEEVERLSFAEVFKMGFMYGMQTISKDIKELPVLVEIDTPLYN
ncbi:hypothetical protein Psch_02182 [Pelotomaculum schinkii]|uniref:Uncharacterized protein n=1 Tax=Pelotomaculum schinkii TaxID=78350 RepID=A0A4Y7RIH3_9FIRM|nr:MULTISPECIES: hypothetical protein [Pelotomaculum]TEB08616.1 hypothetical protein Psch_02182 [Pelotomaculum schinkii]TEB16811.1 hypothetical protein Psfp_00973 [Pelotomaculum sp. FP]